uniref:Uncharacterized protein n=1 Tax=Pararge aegeria TaxID=116150 RepID=S4PVH8_9NEOP
MEARPVGSTSKVPNYSVRQISPSGKRLLKHYRQVPLVIDSGGMVDNGWPWHRLVLVGKNLFSAIYISRNYN